MAATRLSWQQVNAWRLSQHCLAQRLPRPDFIQAVRRIGGVQAQVMSSAEMAIGARVDNLSPQDVQTALWQDRSLIKTWAMRAALHLLAATDLPLYVAARSLTDIRNWPYYFSYYGIDHSTLDEYLVVGPQILSAEPLTRQQFASAVAKRINSPELYQLLTTKGWGTPLKPLAWRGELCFAPSQGQNVTFVRPSAWIGSWQPVEPYAALQEMLRRYLRAYGPATLKDFTQWWGARITPTRKLFKSMEDELEMVEVEGFKAWALSDTLEQMQGSQSMGVVNLLPTFDAYLMGIGRGEEIAPLISMTYQKQVFRPQGWISAVVLVDGYIRGVWEYQNQPSAVTVLIHSFSQLPATIREEIAEQAERLALFFNKKVSLKFSIIE